jgi:hypothetical protein
MGTSRSWVRGVLVLTVAMLTVGALAITPGSTAVDGLSKKEKKQGDKRWVNVGEKATSAATADSATNANTLDGVDSAEFAREADLLSAVVNNAGQTTAALVRGRGATGASGFIATIVTFNRNVNTCAWSATVDDDTGADDQAFAEAQIAASNNEIQVTLFDDTGAIEIGETFHLLVICP